MTGKRKYAAARREQQLIAQGMYTVCICTHTFLGHYAKNGTGAHKGCKVHDCNCKKFESVNVKLLEFVTLKLNRLGFQEQINDTALCKYCNQRIKIGYWHDLMIFCRVREHLRLNHLRKRSPAPTRRTA